MASARKKQDEKHLKILRVLVSNPQNRQCFDCHQRGPTYVNMTIGSFVCTSCSGLLRGLTPPHRVKSISMATFSPEEIELISSRGNEYCRRIWLGLYEPGRMTETRDEQGIKDFMIAKYEKKRYYLGPEHVSGGASTSQSNPSLNSSVNTANNLPVVPPVRPLTNLVGSVTLPALNSVSPIAPVTQSAFTPDNSSSPGFLVDFGNLAASSTGSKVDPFGLPATVSASNSNANMNFADFDNNPIFDAPNETDVFGSFPLSNFGASSDQTSSFSALSLNGDALNFSSKFNPNRWSMPTGSSISSSQSFPGVGQKSSSGSGSLFQQPPAEDRYAALKDLDCLMKSQQSEQSAPSNPQSDWTQAQSTPSWSAFGSSPQSRGFLSSTLPSDGKIGSSTSNPFTGASSNPWNGAENASGNLFSSGQSEQQLPFTWNGTSSGVGVNGTSVNGFHINPSSFPTSQSLNFPTKSWGSEPSGNPFVLGSSSSSVSHSNNPFL